LDYVRTYTRMFGDGAAVILAVTSVENCRHYDAIAMWAETWVMPFESFKCSVRHLGKTYRKFWCNRNGTLVPGSASERDSGVALGSYYVSKSRSMP
jgi:hypothetical protein